jgi:hypothetical protein
MSELSTTGCPFTAFISTSAILTFLSNAISLIFAFVRLQRNLPRVIGVLQVKKGEGVPFISICTLATCAVNPKTHSIKLVCE